MDKSLSKMLIGLFGIPGIVILLFAWLRPMPEVERIMTTLIGVIGLSVAAVQSVRLKNRVTELRAEAESGDSA